LESHALRIFVDQDIRVLNVDFDALGIIPQVDNLIADLPISGQMFNAMSSYAGFDELEPGTGVQTFDACSCISLRCLES